MLIHTFIEIMNDFCPADYTGLIWNACSQHYSNTIFNHCTATVIASGFGLTGDFLFGSGGWGYSGSSAHGHATSDSSAYPSSEPVQPGPNYDSVLSDNLPEEMGGHYQLSDLANLSSSSD